MKVKPTKKAKVISIPEDFSSIRNVYFNGKRKIFTYQIEYDFDIIRALRAGVKDVKITPMSSLPKKKKKTFKKKRIRGKKMTKSLISARQSKRRGTIQKVGKESTRITRKRSDLSKHISNKLTGKRRITVKDLEKETVIRAVPVSSLGKNQAVMKTFIGRDEKGVSRKRTATNSRRAAKNMILRGGIDPANIANKRPPVVSAVENFQGISRAIGKSALNSTRKPSRASRRSYYGYLSGINNIGDNNISSNMLAGNARIPMPVMRRKRKKNVVETLKISARKINGRSFYIKFDVIDKRGIKVQTLVRRVDHQKEMGHHRMPKRAPMLSVAKPYEGLHAIEIKQRDKRATAVLLQYRIINPYQDMADVVFKNVGKYSCDSTFGTTLIKHRAASNMPVIYRAIAMNDRGQLAGSFASTVFTPKTGKDYLSDITGALVIAENQGTHIAVSVYNPPDEFIAWSVLRRDLTRMNAGYEDITYHGQEEVPTDDIVYKDKSIKSGRHYEYKVQFHHIDGGMSYTKNADVVKVTSVDQTNVKLNIKSIESLPTENAGNPNQPGQFSVSLELEVSFSATDTEQLFEFIEASGVSELYDADLQSVKSSLKEMSNFRIRKVDTTKGEVYELGIKKRGIFIDNPATTKTPLRPGSTYVYYVELCISHPSQIFTQLPYEMIRNQKRKMGKSRKNLSSVGATSKALSSAKKSFKSLTSATSDLRTTATALAAGSLSIGSSTLAKADKFTDSTTTVLNPNFPEKFFSNFVANDGTLSYGEALGDNHAESMYEIGATGIVQSVDISFPMRRPQVIAGRAKVRKRKKRRRSHHQREKNARPRKICMLTWRVKGPKRKIDHFIVQAEDMGNRYCIATIHNIAHKGVYRYIDRKHQDNVGDITYFVIPVYLDYDRGRTFNLGTVEY